VLKSLKADLHIHTCLSPCADWDMSPRKIVQRSLDVGLDMIAVCDHNSAENAGAVMQQGSRKGLSVLPGIEICSKEDVHILAYFDTLADALIMQNYVYSNLTGENKPVLFGYQIIASEHDEVLGENPRLLIGATRLGIDEIAAKTHELGGICLPAHVDRTAYGIIGQLGFIPPELKIDAVEVSARVALAGVAAEISGIGNFACLTASDAHFLNDIGQVWTVFDLVEASLAEIRLALKGKDGRKIRL